MRGAGRKKLNVRNITICTCGHVDHGKTALIKALTGIDTDRLKEEKARGISIEAGFAYLEAPGGIRLGVVDAPGHERFVGNMLAATSGIGLALLIVAADEGVMPQTREHLDILRLLNVQNGVIAVTKLDLADAETLEKTREQIKQTVAKTFLNKAKVIEVSVKTGEGLDCLRKAIYDAAAEVPEKELDGHFRLPIDRVFTIRGFGTVVTGTLMDGVLDISAKAMLYPAMLPARIRGLQVHSKRVELAGAGERVAVNLALKKDEISRGGVLAEEGVLVPSTMLDVELEMLESSPFSINNNSRVHLYIGSKRLIAKVVLLEADELAAGNRGFAQLRLEEHVAVKRSDRFIIRFYSPEITIGGGEVLDAVPLKRRRFKPDVIERFRMLKLGLQAVDGHSSENDSLPPESLRKKPLQSLPVDEVEQIYRDFGMNPRAASIAATHIDAAVFSRTLTVLVREEKLVRLDNVTYIHKSCYDEAVSLYKRLEKAGTVELGRYRDELKTSRRVVFALFENFEANGIRRARI